MELKLDKQIAKRATKEVYYEDGKTIKLFVEDYSKANVLNDEPEIIIMLNKSIYYFCSIMFIFSILFICDNS